YTDTGLGENIIYCYSAWAYDERTDMYSNGFVLACGGIPPSDPSDQSLSATTSSFTLNWTKGSSTNTVARRSLNTPPTNQEEGTLVYNGTSASFTDSDPILAKNTTYCYSIWSYNPSTAALSTSYISGCGTLSNMASPTNLTFPTVAYNSIILNWTPGTGSTKTYIVRKQGSIPANKDDGTVVYNDSGNAFIDTGLTDNTQYCYALYANNDTEYTEPLTGCQTTGQLYGSCSELKASGQNTNGVYLIMVNGNTFNVYCDMVTDGGGWTMVVAQYEDDPVTNWNEGIQSDYDPSLNTKKGFTLNTSQIPTHDQVAFGKDLSPTYIDYANFSYTSGNIAKTLLFSPKSGKSYHVHRETGSYYSSHDPEASTGTAFKWNNTLTFDETGGTKGTWAFSPNNDVVSARGYNFNGYVGANTDIYAWTVWVRTVDYYTGTSCLDTKNHGYNDSGYYIIDPDGAGSGASFIVYCDMVTDGGGWTLVLHTNNPNVNTYGSSSTTYGPNQYADSKFVNVPPTSALRFSCKTNKDNYSWTNEFKIENQTINILNGTWNYFASSKSNPGGGGISVNGGWTVKDMTGTVLYSNVSMWFNDGFRGVSTDDELGVFVNSTTNWPIWGKVDTYYDCSSSGNYNINNAVGGSWAVWTR
ncbi:MAG: fibrinogen-like YCDxxxxGGGW domain-containing protein, partial [Candidatus Pacebacteria bacterium]|nr:fibrinogen-like YCDxxxxGGGW domain-containing protein [Candidatus Paceibacterota bacterium]